MTDLLPGVPAAACFDTAFPRHDPGRGVDLCGAAGVAVPRAWRERWAIRRYGFHGLSHCGCAHRAAELVDRPVEELRIVTCHLGSGASLAAVRRGRSVDTTMGFTPLEGLVMATRSGTVDPGLVLWLQEHEHLTAHEVTTALEQLSGLMALAGTGDMRKVEAAAGHGDPDAALALDIVTHRLVAGVAAMAAAAGGFDVLAFTGGVGEHSPVVRGKAARGLAFLGVELDDARNEAVMADGEIGASGAPVRTVVVEAREDLQIAHLARPLLRETGIGHRPVSCQMLLHNPGDVRGDPAPRHHPPGALGCPLCRSCCSSTDDFPPAGAGPVLRVIGTTIGGAMAIVGLAAQPAAALGGAMIGTGPTVRRPAIASHGPSTGLDEPSAQTHEVRIHGYSNATSR